MLRPLHAISRTTLLVALVGAAPVRAQPTVHSLDPLSATEITRAVSVLQRSGRLTPQTRFATITVQPQQKTAPAARAARLLGYDWSRNEGFVAVVDLAAPRVTSWIVVDSEPPMRLLSIRRAEEAAKADPRFVAALRARALDPDRVNLILAIPERTRLMRRGSDRLVRTSVWLRDGIPDAFRAEGLSMRINLTAGTIDSLTDVRRPARITDSSAMRALAAPRARLTALRVVQPSGSAVRITGNEIAWDRWRFRVGVDPRQGLEVHDVSFVDGARRRPVLYSGSVSEIVAPYGDSTFASWYPRDEGDYGMGVYGLVQVVPLNDAPGNASLLRATMHDDRGRPIDVPRAIAVYERDGGLLWRHSRLSRRARQLVVSSNMTIDNYDYQFNWIFGQDGVIEGEVQLTGIMNVNPTRRMRDTAHVEGHATQGHLVAPGINAPNHQHFFAFRLDVDVDGPANTVYVADTQPTDSAANTNGERITMSERPLRTERTAASDVSFSAARTWRVANTHETNALGQFTGYTLAPGSAAPLFARAGSAPHRTAGFAAHQLWVTPHAPDEQYAAGEFQNLSRDDDGLPTWTKADRPISDTDVVLWYTLGVTHIPRPEDWPYMPVHRGSFRLVPTSFFARNPALDVPETR